jgi:hypothetical protein
MRTADPTATGVPAVVADIRLVPDAHRVFDVDAGNAHRLHGVDAALLAQLTEAGLPHRGSGAGRRYDMLDLVNAGLALRLPAPRILAMRRWPRTLAARDRAARYRLEVRPECSGAAHAGPCRFTAAPEIAAAAAASGPADVLTVSVTMRPPAPAALPAPVVDLLAPCARLRYHVLPDGLVDDLGFVTETGLADCRSAARLLARDAGRAGVPHRRSFGLFVSSPYSGPHEWVEFEVDGRWEAADPLLLTSLARWGLVDPQEWPWSRPITHALWRAGPAAVPLAHDHGEAVHASILTSAEAA